MKKMKKKKERERRDWNEKDKMNEECRMKKIKNEGRKSKKRVERKG